VSNKQISLMVDPSGLVRSLAVIAVLLVLLSSAFWIVRILTGHDEIFGLVGLFDLDGERNLPSFFSGCLFLLNALLFVLVARAAPGGTSRTSWLALAGLFLFLSFDELFGVHERLTTPVREALHTSGFLYYSWVLIYVPAVALLACGLIPVWRRLHGPARSWLGRAAVTYMAGAVGLEMTAGAYHVAAGTRRDLVYGILATVEESLEMAGLIMLTYALLLLLTQETDGDPRAVSRSASSRT
jgi:hypothetical protein